MEEKMLMNEGDYAITTHRIVWGPKSGVASFDDIDMVYVNHNEAWKGVASFGILALFGFGIGALWSIIAAFAMIGLAYWTWNSREDNLFVKYRNGQDKELPIPKGLTSKVVDALEERRNVVYSFNAELSAASSRSAIEEIRNLSSN